MDRAPCLFKSPIDAVCLAIRLLSHQLRYSAEISHEYAYEAFPSQLLMAWMIGCLGFSLLSEQQSSYAHFRQSMVRYLRGMGACPLVVKQCASSWPCLLELAWQNQFVPFCASTLPQMLRISYRSTFYQVLSTLTGATLVHIG